MSDLSVNVEFTDDEEDLIKTVLTEAANAASATDPESADQLRDLKEMVIAEDGIDIYDWQTIAAVLDAKGQLEFESKHYDENQVADSALNKMPLVTDEA